MYVQYFQNHPIFVRARISTPVLPKTPKTPLACQNHEKQLEKVPFRRPEYTNPNLRLNSPKRKNEKIQEWGNSTEFQSSFPTDAGLIALAKGCPDLRTVSLKKCVEVTHVGLSQIVRSCVHLESLNLTDCLGIRDSGFEDVERCGSELRHLEVSGFVVLESILGNLESQSGLTVTNTPYHLRDDLRKERFMKKF
jgi:hypothetical protein